MAWPGSCQEADMSSVSASTASWAPASSARWLDTSSEYLIERIEGEVSLDTGEKAYAEGVVKIAQRGV